MRNLNYVLLATFLIPFTIASAAPKLAVTEKLEERRVTGTDATTLADAMKESGAKKEPIGENGGATLPSDHPPVRIGKDYVYRMSSIYCENKQCRPFVLSAAKMKKIERIFIKNRVKTKPSFFMRDLVCGAEADAGAEIACFITAHFSSKAAAPGH